MLSLLLDNNAGIYSLVLEEEVEKSLGVYEGESYASMRRSSPKRPLSICSVQCNVSTDLDSMILEAPLIVVEVTSPSSERDDTGDKLVEYFE